MKDARRLHRLVIVRSVDTPDQLEDIVDEAGAVVAAQGGVVVLQQVDEGVPAVTCVVHHVVAAHVHVELHPVRLLRQVQDICMEEELKNKIHNEERSCSIKMLRTIFWMTYKLI